MSAWKIYWGRVYENTPIMTSYTDSPLTRQHSHRFDQGNPLGEKNAKLAMLLTLAMMVLEITAGYYFNSMALLADGWHMSSHALALGLSVSAYAGARKLANDRRFSFGTWKIEILAGYTSAIFLLLVAALMAFESIQRLLSPAAIHYQQAIGVATLGLLVNLACAWLLKDGHHHHQGHEHHSDHHHGHNHAHGDLNLRSAYLHVIADAATSVMAIAALLGGMLLGFVWLDSVMGLVGSAMVAIWALGLLRDSCRVLLDAEMDAPVVEEVREAIAQGPQPVNITDLHVWRVGKNHYACIIAVEVEGAATVTPDYIRQLLSVHEELSHVSVEVNSTEPA